MLKKKHKFIWKWKRKQNKKFKGLMIKIGGKIKQETD